MAIMYPERPKNYDVRSAEGIMFDALKKLPNSYHVFHSTDIMNVSKNKLFEHEIDFIIFNRNKGILCIEAKNGQNIVFEKNEWYIGKDKILMKHGGPFKQAQMNKLYLLDILEDRFPLLRRRCKFMHAVWFPAISEQSINTKFPIGADKKILLTNEALQEPQKYIEKIFDLENEYDIETNLSASDENIIISKFLCPTLNLCETRSWNKTVFNKLLEEQVNILNFLDEQKNAIINGVAGSGKTFVALEKARRCAENGESVLFLCFNKRLSEHLNKKYHYDNVTITHIDKFSCQICKTNKSDLIKLAKYYNDNPEEFNYDNLIIDEGQDFGQDRIESSQIIQILKTIVEMKNGCFYVFYDKNQLVQGKDIPSYIKDADCKLTLYRNCRNTENIALTSTRIFKDFKVKTNMNIMGNNADIFISKNKEDILSAIKLLLKKYKSNGVSKEDIVILTCAPTEEKSCLFSYKDELDFFDGVEFTTCRKFKGLEADTVILIDVTKNIFIEDYLLFYTGTSRARFDLSVICNMDEQDCQDIMKYWNSPKSNRNIYNLFADKLNANIFKLDRSNSI